MLSDHLINAAMDREILDSLLNSPRSKVMRNHHNFFLLFFVQFENLLILQNNAYAPCSREVFIQFFNNCKTVALQYRNRSSSEAACAHRRMPTPALQTAKSCPFCRPPCKLQWIKALILKKHGTYCKADHTIPLCRHACSTQSSLACPGRTTIIFKLT